MSDPKPYAATPDELRAIDEALMQEVIPAAELPAYYRREAARLRAEADTTETIVSGAGGTAGAKPVRAGPRARPIALLTRVGYGPDKPLNINVTTRDLQAYQQPANGELEIVDTAQYFPKIIRNDFTVALNLNPGGPSPTLLSLFYACGASLNWDRYCDPQTDKLIEQQGEERDAAKRKQILWKIERKLAADFVRPVLFYGDGGTCMRPFVKGLTIKVDSLYNGWRMEDAWLDK
jgi:ABC-type transport system substrate-binding protein